MACLSPVFGVGDDQLHLTEAADLERAQERVRTQVLSTADLRARRTARAGWRSCAGWSRAACPGCSWPTSDNPASGYGWFTAPASCDAQSLNDYGCTRPAGHRGGHSFTMNDPTP
jgi:hypothetical protein